MRRPTVPVFPALVCGFVLSILLLGSAETAEAQGLLGRIKQKAKEKAAMAGERAATSLVNGAESMVRCTVGDGPCIEKAKASGKTVITSAGDTIRPPNPAVVASSPTPPPSGGPPPPPPVSVPSTSPAAAGAPTAPAATSASVASDGGDAGTGVWLNWDFKPGDKPIVIEDFSRDEVGNFPRRMALHAGNFEVADVGGRRMLRTNTVGAVSVTLPSALPDRFTLEFDVIGSSGTAYVSFEPLAPRGYVQHYPGDPQTYVEVDFGHSGSGLYGGGVSSAATLPAELKERVVTERLMVDGAYAKLYLDDTRVANVPITKIPRSKRITFSVYAYTAAPVFIGNIRVMAGGKKLYDALLKNGRVATQGIYFDTGSDRLRGESSATLKEIAQMLTDHAELKLTIEGHTDNVGAAASNQTLSERRAAAVRAALVRNYGVAEERLASVGFGSAKPVAPNTAEEGRQQNRRVELVRMGS